MYSPWHLDIAHKYGIGLICTSDVGYFVKIGDDIFNLKHSHTLLNLYDYFVDLEKRNNSGELSDEDVIDIVRKITNGEDERFRLDKCTSLDEFEKQMKEMKRNKDNRDAKR